MKTQTPKIRRTRRHVVIRLTPAEANAAFMLASRSAMELPHHLKRNRRRVIAILMDASKAGDNQIEPKPNATSIGTRKISPEYP